MSIALLSLLLLFTCFESNAQDEEDNSDLIVTAAKELIQETNYCALITLDSTGHPQVRTMEVLPIEEDFTVWFGTNKNSRKVKEVENDPRVTVYYADPSGNGYVVLTGTAVIVDDKKKKEEYWKDDWDQFYPDREKIFILIKVVPDRLEVVSYKHGITGDSITWRAPSVSLSTH
jgi:general stress protein 26